MRTNGVKPVSERTILVVGIVVCIVGLTALTALMVSNSYSFWLILSVDVMFALTAYLWTWRAFKANEGVRARPQEHD